MFGIKLIADTMLHFGGNPFNEFKSDSTPQVPPVPAADGGPPPGYSPVPNRPGLYYIPGTNYVVAYTPGNRFSGDAAKIDAFPLSVGKSILGNLASSAADGGASALHDDPRYWANLDREFALEQQKLAAQYTNMGLDSESARRQALASLIANRNNTAVDTAQTSLSAAEAAAKFAANPRDAVADLMYRNAIGGATPYGSTNNAANDTRKAMLDAKFQELFGPVAGDLGKLREYRDAIPPVEFFGPETRTQLGLPPTTAQALVGGTGGGASSPTATAPANPLQALTDKLNAFSPEDKDAFRKWVTAANGPTPMAEDGVNLNIMEPAMVVGMSGKIYTTLAENDPEQLRVIPLPSVMERKKKEKEAAQAMKKATAGTQRMAEGGTINAIPGTEDFMEQLSMLLGRLGGAGGGTGAFTGQLPDIRLLAGAPENALMDDPDLAAYTQAGYSSQGISPETLEATLKKFRPADAMRRGQTSGRVSFL